MKKADAEHETPDNDPENRDEKLLDRLVDGWKQMALPQQLVHFAVFTGLCLAAAGFFLPGVTVNDQARANLALSAGIGIAMMALGTQAIGVWKGIAMGGAAPVVLLLYGLLPKAEPVIEKPVIDVSKSFIHSLKLPKGAFPTNSQVRIIDRGREILGCLDNEHTVYRFVIEDGQFQDLRPDLYFVDGAVPQMERLKGDKLNSYIKQGKRLDLMFDRDNRKVYLPNALPDGANDDVNEPLKANPAPAGLDIGSLLPLSPGNAYAAESVGSLVDKLTDRDLDKQVEANEQLRSSGGPSVPPLVAEFRSRPDAAARGNILSVLRDLIRTDSHNRESVANAMTANDLKIVIALQSNDDKSTRSTATEFLIALNDPESVDALLDSAKTAQKTGRINALVALENLLKDQPPAEVAKIVTTVKALAATEPDVQVQQRMNEFDEPVYLLVLASFSDSQRAKQKVEELRKQNYASAEAYPLRSNSYFVATAFRDKLRIVEKRRLEDIAANKITPEAWAIRQTSLGPRVFP
jgi:hypothetical protein